MNGIPIQTIKLSTGELYTPERGKASCQALLLMST